MKGNFKLNDKDAFTTWGCFLGNNSVDQLLTPAPAKKRLSNESRLLPGKQVIEGDNIVASRDVTLIVYFKGKGLADIYSKIENFTTELLTGISTFILTDLPLIKFKLDYDSASSLKQVNGKLAKISIKLNEPNPSDRS